jgi:YVTN family beta-propeller protein
MQLAVRPDGALIVVGTEAFNQIRFEPNLTGQFVRSRLAIVPDGSVAPQVLELNPHLLGIYDTAVKVVAPEVRALSIADPRALAWSSDGGYGYVAGMGSNNVAVIDPAGARLATFDVGQGPTGLALDEPRGLLYVFNRFDATIQTIDTQTLTTTQVTAIYDPTPQVIRSGRPFLYNARQTSGLGVTACGACHVDGRMDQLAWDLGAPHEPVKSFDQVCDDITEGLLPDAPPCNDFHPIKGPMVTQTLQGIIGTEPLHWRGDRADLAAFNPAFVTLNGNDRELSPEEMAAFEAFLATVTFPPNPNRSRDNSLKQELDGGNPRRGREIYLREPIDTATGRLHGAAPLVRDTVERIGPILTCNRCHHLPSGTNGLIISKVDLLSEQAIKVPQLRNIHEKTGFDRGSTSNHSGFGFAHDGSFGTLEDFFDLGVFDFGTGEEGAQRLRDVIAFLHSLGVDTHAGVGTQVTLTAANALAPAVVERIEMMIQVADGGQVGLVVHGTLEGALRGLAYRGAGRFQADGAGDTWTTVQLWEAAIAGEAQTWTTVPLGSEERLGLQWR